MHKPNKSPQLFPYTELLLQQLDRLTEKEDWLLTNFQKLDHLFDLDADGKPRMDLKMINDEEQKAQRTKKYWLNPFKLSDDVRQSTVTP